MKEEQLVHSWGKNYNQSDRNNTLVLYEHQFMIFQTAIQEDIWKRFTL